MARKIEVEIVGDASSYQRALGKATKTSSGFGSSVARMGRVAAAGLVAAGVAAAVGAKKAVDAASDLSESVNAVNVVFGKSADKILEWGQTADEAAGLSQRAFNEAATPIGSMLQNMGMGASDAADETIALTQRAADLASVFNTDLDEALTAIQAGLRGEADPLERFGVGLSEAAIQAYAVKNGIAEAGETMTAAQKTTARLGLFFEQTNKVAGDFANTSGGLANQQRILRARIENLAAGIGKILLPVVTAFVTFLNDKAIPALEGFAGFLREVAEAKTINAKIRIVWANVKEAAGRLWGALGAALFGETTRKPLKLPSGKIIEWETTETQGLVNAIGEGIATADWSQVGGDIAHGIWKAFMDAVRKLPATPEEFVKALGLDRLRDRLKASLGRTMHAVGRELNPKNWAWQATGDWISGQLGLAGAKQAVQGWVNDITDLFGKIKPAISKALSGIGDTIKNPFQPILTVIQWIRNLITAIGDIPSSIHLPSIDLPDLPSPGGGVPFVPGIASGGDIARSGLAVVHRGERVVPARVVNRGGDGRSAGGRVMALLVGDQEIIGALRALDERSGRRSGRGVL